MSDWTSTVKLGEMGRGLVATKDLVAGEQIVGSLKPLVAALNVAQLEDTCYNCMKHDHDPDDGGVEKRLPLSCTKCERVKYCSKVCKRVNWNAVHKYECEIFATFPEDRPLLRGCRALIQILVLKDLPRLARRYAKLDGFESHMESFKKENPAYFSTMETMAQMVTAFSELPEDIEVMHEILCRVAVNAFTLNSVFGDPIGIVVEPTIAMINHSCQPNAFVHLIHGRSGLTISLRASQSIQKGEQIFMSYVEETNPVHMRQTLLQKSFYFVCKCNRCQLNPELEATAAQCDPAGPASLFESNAFELLDDFDKTQDTDLLEEVSMAISALRRDGYKIHQQPLPALRNCLITGYSWGPKKDMSWVFLHSFVQHARVDAHLLPYASHPIRLIHQLHLVKLTQHLELKGLRGNRAAGDKMRVLWEYLLWDLRNKTDADVGTWSIADEVKKLFEESGGLLRSPQEVDRLRPQYDRVFPLFDRLCADSVLRAEELGVPKNRVKIPAMKDVALGSETGEDEWITE